MFVIYGFQFKDISRWNERCERESVVFKILIYIGQSDFIIFYYIKGVILIEVKNLKELDINKVEIKIEGVLFQKDYDIDKVKN